MRRVWVRELAGWAGAIGVALAVAGQVAASARSELMFRDGDSLIVAMFARSLLAGGPLDWAMSSVLFLPESAVFATLQAVLPWTLDALLALSGVLNLLALYGALRLVAGRRRPGRAPVAWSLIALGVFGAIAATETSASRDALELASLQLTTTYYAATVVAVVAVIGLLRRALERDGGVTLLFVSTGAVTALSVLTNPLFAVWATVPLSALLAFWAVRGVRRPRMLALIGVLVGSSAVGFLARIPFAAWIANTGVGYAQPERWAESIGYYGALLAERLSTPWGVLGTLLITVLIVVAVWRTVRATDDGERLVATASWLVPVLVTIGAIALGTHAARYLQPAVFAPVLALLAAPRVLLAARASRLVAIAAAGAIVIAGAIGVPRLVTAVQRPDADLACVVDWVQSSGRTGAGQFWTVRLPKAHLSDPARLVQVDHRLNGYAWLVNRTDLDVGEVTFLVEDAQSVRWELPSGAEPDAVVTCGRYRILDFGSGALPVGPPHS
ncbi:hypothetical protein [Streptomyces sp. AC495_CC817]|uniref:hypothetical protein n=1 Tax=Streptomyces sp. AC495_CC817 TaxID=2823900 RepID=UPI001C280867|nr:hypothetical protein [Streptomyces sp. AC495_CC817]